MLNCKRLIIAAASAALLVSAAGADEPAPPRQPTIELKPGKPQAILIDDTAEFWLGLNVSRPSAAMRAQLHLEKDQGLVVESVLPDSPAAKAGIEKYDVLLKANETALSEPPDLQRLIQAAKNGKLNLELIRSGQRKTVVATPDKRPASEVGGAEGPVWQFRLIGPGQLLKQDGTKPITIRQPPVIGRLIVDLRDGTKIEITREGDAPAKVVVQRDKEHWEATEKNLDNIPKDLRPEVEQWLKRSSSERMGFFTVPVLPPMSDMSGGNVEKRLAEMQKQIDELRKQVEALKK